MGGDILNNILKFGRGEKFIKLVNTVGQVWYFPYYHIHSYLSLYQPSSIKGTIVKFFLPVIKYSNFFLPFVNARVELLEIDNRFQSLLVNTFEIQGKFSFALFCGSPGVHQKPTFLVASDNKCVGYCKLSNNKKVIDIFIKEKDNLDFLNSIGLCNIPTIRYCSPIHEDIPIWAFCQTTQRKDKVSIATIEEKKVLDFISQLYEKTKIKMDFKDSDFCGAMNNLESLLFLLKDEESIKIIKNSIADVRAKLLLYPQYYSAYHGDLTPWNSFLVDNHFFVFDFEYFKRFYIPFADFFHFFTQTMIFDYGADVEEIWSKYNNLKPNITYHIENSDFYYKCYLLGIIEFYLNRDKENINIINKSSLSIWVGLLSYIERNVPAVKTSFVSKGRLLSLFRRISMC